MTRILWKLLIVTLVLLSATARAGRQIEIADPLYFERPHEVIFPWADAKLVSFEFEAATGVKGGKQKAKELHDLFLAKIQGLPGGAVLTYLTPEGKRIENYRITARKAAEQQKAQMSLWGRIFPDESGDSLINVRLELVEPPNGIQADFESRIPLQQHMEQPIRGLIRDEITQTRIDFLTVEENNISALSEFLSGLAFYYKGAKHESTHSKRLLHVSIDHLQKYIEATRNRVDFSAASAANLYIARAWYHLSQLETAQRSNYLRKAATGAEKAIRLNPYEADPYTVQAVIMSAQNRDVREIEGSLEKAASLAPGSPVASYNLALVKSGSGQFKEAIRKLEQVEFLQTRENQPVYSELPELQQKLRSITEKRQ
jgi:tetratricopeptide (TPR) repeat protein